jgi:5-hydroxyisourate hydrolase-like protein (transthyretin family)
MRPSGHRAIRTLAVFLVLALGVAALLPLIARGATGQVTGFVSTCGTTTPFVAGAVVSLIDVNGISPTLTAVADGAGVYAFVSPPTPSGSYTIAASHAGYYSNATTVPQRFDGSSTTTINLCMVLQPTPSKVLKVHVQSAGSPVSGATVAAFNISTGKPQLVRSNTTNAMGDSNLTLWAGSFQLRTSAATYQTDQTTVDVSVTTSVTISLVAGSEVFGHVTDPKGNFLGSGVVAWLYNPGASNTSTYRLIAAAVSSSLFDFHAPTGTYTIIVDADGYLAKEALITVGPGVTKYDVTLQPAPREVFQTTVAFGARDWNNLTVWRNLTLNADSTLTGLTPINLRDLRLQIDATLGDGNGVLSPGEITSFSSWLVKKGPAYVTTDGFFTTNGRAYVNVSSYTVNVAKLDVPGSRVWINTTATYTVKQTPPWIAAGAKNYFVNVTTIPDTNVSAYQDNVYIIILPKTYELNTTTTIPSNAAVTIANFTRVTIDPGVCSACTPGTLPQVRMKVSQSVNGTARAKVDSPIGKFYVQNATFTNYQAFVAGNTTLVFSANDSTDPNGHLTNANFTWKFTPNPGDVRYGIDPTFKYTRASNFTVNLKIIYVGGNVTFRNITVFVDDQHPIAKIKTNRTGSGNANGTALKVDQGTIVKFDGGLSTDLAYLGKNGVILNSGYAWDFNGDRIVDATGRVVNWTFQKPGNFKVNLTVTDSVGWKSINATINATVNDTKGPVPVFDILDPSKDWATITSPIEQKTIALNASKTTDNYDKLSALNFTWTIPGPLVGFTGLNHTFWGVNISFAWREWNNSYKVVLATHDTGFPTGKWNYGNLTRNITVQIDPTLHADLRVIGTTLKVSPADPEEGATITVTINVTNKVGRKSATNVATNLSAFSGGQTTLVTNQAQWFDKNGNPKANQTIGPGETVKLVFTGTLSGQGNKTLQVYIYDTSEPYTWLVDNRASTTVNVRQPAWQPFAIAGSVIGIIALFVFGMYARRKIKAGEWRPIRGRRRERGEEGEKRPRREGKEEKKRL